MLQVDHESVLGHLRVVDRLFREDHRPARDLVLLEERQPFIRRARGQDQLGLPNEASEALPAVRAARVELRVLARVLDARHLAELGLERRAQAADGDERIARLVVAVVHVAVPPAVHGPVAVRLQLEVGRAARAQRRQPGDELFAQRGIDGAEVVRHVAGGGDAGRQERGLDALALAGGLAHVERRAHGHRGEVARAHIGHRGLSVQRLAVAFLADERGKAGDAGGDHVIAAEPAHRPLMTEAGVLQVDHLRVEVA